MPQDLLNRPERHVVEPAYESNNIGGDLPLVLLVPLAAAQFLRLDGTEYGQVQQGQLQMDIDHYNGDRLDGHEADEPDDDEDSINVNYGGGMVVPNGPHLIIPFWAAWGEILQNWDEGTMARQSRNPFSPQFNSVSPRL